MWAICGRLDVKTGITCSYPSDLKGSRKTNIGEIFHDLSQASIHLNHKICQRIPFL